MNFNITVGVVIVTFNRIEKLINTLKYYDSQEWLPEYILIVNNASTDGTQDFLEEWCCEESRYKKYVITLDENVGGSGGFFVGEKKAMELDANWIMIADDDAYPDKNYIKGMVQYIQSHNSDDISVVCGSVLENDSYFNNHRGMIISPWKLHYRRKMTEKEYRENSLNIDLVSYVGILINKEKLKKVGLVNKDYFIWNDDIEHSLRLKKVGTLIYIPSYTIFHDCDLEHQQLSWKSYYGHRNRIDLFRRHFFFPFLVNTTIFLLKTLLSPLKGRSFTEVKIRLTAIYDGVFGNLGKHKIYKPGWKP